MPNDLLELQPYVQSPVAQEALQRYELVQSGTLQWDKPAIAEKIAVDDQNDWLFKYGASAFWWQAAGQSHIGSGGMSRIPTNDPPQIAVADARMAPEAKPPDDGLDQYLEKSPDARPLREALKVFQALHDGHEPENVAEILPFLMTRPPEERAATEKVLERLLSADSQMTTQERAALEDALKELQPGSH